MEEYHRSEQNEPPDHHLSEKHAHQLFDESGIDPGVARERGYRTVERRAELTEFPEWQRRLGLYVPTYSPDGETAGCLLRPDKLRKSGPKYEAPQGSGVSLDVHPRARRAANADAQDLFVVEGIKKADALLSRGVPTVALTSVWMAHVPKSKPKRLLPCWDHVRLSGRSVFIVFDSDWKRNDTVHAALEWLVGALEDRGADVRVAYLDDKPDGSKVGADDYLSAGGTVAELKALCRKFEPQDVGRIRISKDEKLRALATDLEHRFWNEEWKGMGAHSSRDVYLKLIEAAVRRGKIHTDGLRVVKAWGPLMLEAKISSPRTMAKAIRRLEEWGLVYRDNRDRKRDKSGAFVLTCRPRASVKYKGGRHAAADNAATKKETTYEEAFGAGAIHLRGTPRVPRLMWPRPKWKPAAEMRRKYRMGEMSRLPETRDRIERLGKIRGAIVDALAVAGGSLTLQDLGDLLQRKRLRDIRRRNLPMLEEAGIITVDGDLVSLTEDWLDCLEGERAVGREIEAEVVAHRRYKLKTQAYHGWFSQPTSEVSEASEENIARSREAREAAMANFTPGRENTSKAEKRICQLIREGMAEKFARAEVLGDPDPLAGLGPPRRKSPTSVPLVGGIYRHGQECGCMWCEDDPAC